MDEPTTTNEQMNEAQDSAAEQSDATPQSAPALEIMHTEATCLAFTEFWTPQGQRINVTVRQGATRQDLDGLFAAINFALFKGLDAGWLVSPPQAAPRASANVEQSAAPQSSASAPAAAKSNGAQQHSASSKPGWGASDADSRKPGADGRFEFRLAKIQLTVDVKRPDKPDVQFWSVNNAYKYAVGKAPVWLVKKVLIARYPELDGDGPLAFLDAQGGVIECNWLAYFETSQRDARYKDLVDIIVPKLEEEHAANGTPTSAPQSAPAAPPQTAASAPAASANDFGASSVKDDPSSFWTWAKNLAASFGLSLDDVRPLALRAVNDASGSFKGAAPLLVKKLNEKFAA